MKLAKPSPPGAAPAAPGCSVSSRRVRPLCRAVVWRAVLALLVAAPWARALGILVPAYFPPTQTSAWEALNQAAQRVPLVAIINPHNGPSDAVEPGYARVVNALRQAGGRVLGYVQSAYAARAPSDVKADIDRYHEFYELDGIFLDEMTNDALEAHLAYYADLHGYVKAKRASYLVVGNPGTRTAASYLTRPTADALVTFENRTGYASYVPDPWTATQPFVAFAHLCYEVASAVTMARYVEAALARNAGYIYITDDGGANPWDTLPSYWQAEVEHVETINRRLARERPPRLELTRPRQDAIRVRVVGPPGRYRLEASPDLVDWTAAATNVSATGDLAFELLRAADPASRFFRTVP